MPLSALQCYIIIWIVMSGLLHYIYVWIAMLYYVWFANFYLFLLYKIIPTSVMVTSIFATFDLRHVIPSSGLQCLLVCYICISHSRFLDFTCYGIVCYIMFCVISRYNERWYDIRFSHTGYRYNMSYIQFSKSRSCHNRCRMTYNFTWEVST